MKIRQWLIRGVAIGLLSMALGASIGHAAGESYALGYEVIGDAERVLTYAAIHSPKWHRRQEAIQRDVYDITFLLEQAWRAVERGNDTAQKDYAHQALTLLQRAVAKGHFDAGQIEPVLRLIRDLLPNVTA